MGRKSLVETDMENLLHKLQEGDERAFEHVYDEYAHRLSVKLYQVLRSEELAKDILQDVFIKLWEIREQVRSDLPLSGLLYKIATNMSYNVYQRALKEQMVIRETWPEEAHNPVEASMDNKEIAELLNRALDTLTPRQREVYTLHKTHGLSYSEISEQLQISRSAINHHIQEANKRLRIYLQPYIPLLLLGMVSTMA